MAKKATKKKSVAVKKKSKKKGDPLQPKTVRQSLSQLATKINERSGVNYGFASAGEFYSDITSWITTTCTPFDVMLWGGFPRGRIIDIHGDPSQGKSTLMEAVFIGNQRVGGENICLVSEGCLDTKRMGRCGLDLDSYLPVEMDTVEDGYHYILEVLKHRQALDPAYVLDHPTVLGWDTMSNAQERYLIENPDDAFGQGMASKARNIRQMLRTIVPLATRLNVTIILLFQTHARIGKGYSGKDTDCGGGPKFNASLRLHAKWSGEKLFKPGMAAQEIGIYSQFLMVKSRVGPPPFSNITIPIRAWDGIDNDLAMFNALREVWVTDSCPVCGGKIANTPDLSGKRFWLSESFKTCDQCNKTGSVFHLIGGNPSTICIDGVSSAGNATQYRYIYGWPNEGKITFKEGELRGVLDARPGLRTWMAEQCWKQCAKPEPPVFHPVE